jgi:phosphogluconate dehydratase
MNKTILQITERIYQRSENSRSAYLKKIAQQSQTTRYRSNLSCGNLAHGFAACNKNEKIELANCESPNIAIISSYNDMLSAHQPYFDYPKIIKQQAHLCGATAQFAGGVPAMCDGVTQGRAGMELSLFSRDNIAMSAAIALSHDMFDGVTYLGICDKIVPGLLIGALSFGHLPGIFIPAGPMKSGLSNKEKVRIRQAYAKGELNQDSLLIAESESYHSAGTCTFYGTANSNQMLMEFMGLQLPGSSFEQPDSLLRQPLTDYSVRQLVNNINQQKSNNLSIAEIISVETLVNGVIGLLATGGSTNHTLHLVAIARAAGIILDWQDMAELSKVIPLLSRVYPNGSADVNQFHKAGGIAYVMEQLLNADLLFNDVKTVMGSCGLDVYTKKPFLKYSNIIAQTADTSGTTNAPPASAELSWKSNLPNEFFDDTILGTVEMPFANQGGLNLLTGNLGKAIIKTSAIDNRHQIITAPAKVFQTQQAMIDAFDKQQLNCDFVAVVIFQGPKSNGMPELHQLTPILGVLQDQGFKVALVTDGRMSGASGKVPAAIHLTPEASQNGPIGRINDGDIIHLDCKAGVLQVKVAQAEFSQRSNQKKENSNDQQGMARELFNIFRKNVNPAEYGASIFELDIHHTQELKHA